MRKALVTWVVGMILAGCAHATLRLFVTSASAAKTIDDPWGLDDRSYSCIPSVWCLQTGDDCEYYQVTDFPPADFPSGSCGEGTNLVCPGRCGDFVGGYVWFQMVGESKGAKVNGLVIAIEDCDTGVLVSTREVFPTYYNPFCPPLEWRRWNGAATPPDCPEWHNNPQCLVGITAGGITAMCGSDPMCDPYTHTTLLAAVVPMGPTPNVAANWQIRITEVSYWTGTPTQIVLQSGFFQCVPRGDLNCDRQVNFGDINPFIELMLEPERWKADHPGCPIGVGDLDGNGTVGFEDINPFVALLVGGLLVPGLVSRRR